MVFNNFSEIVELAESRGVKISEIIKEWEIEKQETRREVIEDRMRSQWIVMKESVENGLNNPEKSMGGLIGGQGKKLMDYSDNKKTEDGYLRSAARALAVAELNASMGKIVASPTAGSCGILPGVLMNAVDKYGSNEEEIIDALFTASGLGIIIAQNASISGAEGGCQAECGSAAAMASAALVELMGGSPNQVANAAAMVIKNVLGLVCDPVAGLVEVPCAKRNVMGTVLALVSADMAVAGIESVIPLDEVILAMEDIGRSMPSGLKETAKGGLAVTKTAQEIAKKMKSGGV